MTNTDFTARCMAGKALDDVAGKQDIIADLDTIRAGAAAGATAVQPAALSDYQPKIDSTHKLDADLVDDVNSTNKFATQAELEQIELNKNNISWNTNNSVKNLAKVTTTAGSYSGFTVSATNTAVTLESGTQSPAPASNIIPLTGSIALKAGTYKLTGCPATGSDSTYRMDIRAGATVLGGDYGAGGDIVITADTNATIYIRCERGFSITTPLTFTPMLCPKSLYDADPTYQPYAMSNAELTAAIQALQAQLNQ